MLSATAAERRPGRAWALIRPYAAQHRGRAARLGGMLLAAAVLQVANPQLVRYYIDRVVSGTRTGPLVAAAVAYLVVAAVIQAVRVRAAYLGESLAWDMTNALRADLARHCLRLDHRFHKDHSPGELIERVDGDVTTVATFLSSAFFVIVSNLVLVLGIFVSLFVTDWRIGCVLLGYAACALGALLLVRGIALGAWDRVRASSAGMFGFLGERLAGVEDLRTSRAEGYVLDRLSGLNDEMLRNQRTAMVRSGLIFTVMHGLYLFGYGGALALGAYLYARGMTSLGTVYLVISYTNFIYMPLNEVRAQIQDMQRAMAGIKRVRELFDAAPSVVDGPGLRLPAGPPSVELRGVSFRYGPDAPWALRDVSLTLAPGEVLGVMGRTGSGKTTLARLLGRMDDPTEGAVLVGGRELTLAGSADLGRLLGVVTQDVQILRGTVYENITLYDDTVDRGRVERTVERLGLSGWLATLPDGLDTELTSGQASLSAGEAQLLAVCRVFLRDPGVVLLDEVSSRLDAETERLLESALTGLLAGRTGVVIGHRVSTVDRADRIVFLEDGRIVEAGDRSGLLADTGSRLSRLVASTRQEIVG